MVTYWATAEKIDSQVNATDCPQFVFVTSVCNLRVVLDQELTFPKHRNLLCRACFISCSNCGSFLVQFDQMSHLLLFVRLFVVGSTTAVSVFPLGALGSLSACCMQLLIWLTALCQIKIWLYLWCYVFDTWLQNITLGYLISQTTRGWFKLKKCGKV